MPQNTDPYVFGPCFKYFVCKQIKRFGKRGGVQSQQATWLAGLEAGSVVLFGSTAGTAAAGDCRFLLDTVFVVGDWLEYDPWHPDPPPDDPRVDTDFLRASYHVALPTVDGGSAAPGPKLRLYLGATPDATPDASREGMYSFSPARVVVDGKPAGFPRVELRDSDFRGLASVIGKSSAAGLLTDNLNSAAKGTRLDPEDMAKVWKMVRDKCREAGCVEGTGFSL